MINLRDYWKKEIAVTFKDGQVVSGKAVVYCSALDAPDGVPSLAIKEKPNSGFLIEITENDIKDIENIQILK